MQTGSPALHLNRLMSEQSLLQVKAAESGQPIGNQSTQTMHSAGQKTAGAAEIPISDQISQPPKKPKPYKKPPLTLLKRSDASSNKNSERQLKETALQLKQTLKTFGVNVTITDISQGPAVTRYELQPEMGVKVSKIVNLSDDIKLNLAATDIRIEAPIPGKRRSASKYRIRKTAWCFCVIC